MENGPNFYGLLRITCSIHDHQVQLFQFSKKFKGISISNKECNVILGKDKRILQNAISFMRSRMGDIHLQGFDNKNIDQAELFFIP